MDDRLQRRLRDADPLTASDGQTPSPARLDAIKEQIMQTDERPVRAAIRPRALGLVGVAAVSLALVLVVGSLARPAATTLAWAPEPTAVTAEQKAAAEKACTENVVVGSGTIRGGSGIVEGGEGEVPAPPPAIVTLPPLVSLELHGNGGVAILSDGRTTGYCLLRWDGTTFTAGGLALGIDVPTGFADGFLVSGMGTEFEGQALGIVAGAAPAGAATVEVRGGPADGGTATVQDGKFALWVPGMPGGDDVELVAYDAAGNELGRQTLSKGGEQPEIVTLTPDPANPDGLVEGRATPAP
jgi:hypothetical protein